MIAIVGDPVRMSSKSVWIYTSATHIAKDNFTYVQEIGRFFDAEGYCVREKVPSFLIYIVIKGEYFLEYENSQYRMKSNSLFWIDCRERQCYGPVGDVKGTDVIWVHFWGGNSENYYNLFKSFNESSPIINYKISSSIPVIVDNLLKECQTHNNNLRADITANSLLIDLMNSCLKEIIEPAESISDIVQSVKEFLLANYNSHITLESLSKCFSFSPFYLQKKFKSQMGVTPFEYLQHIRMLKSVELIRSTVLSLEEIATRVGFESLSHFSKVFKKEYGMTPSQYRKSWNIYEVNDRAKLLYDE